MNAHHHILLFLILLVGVVAIALIGFGTLLSFLIIFLIVFIASYLQSIDAQDRQEALKHQFEREQEEQAAQKWLHETFTPHTHKYLKENIRVIYVSFGLVLLILTFCWSFFISGLVDAEVTVLFTIIFYTIFILYMIYAPKFLNIFFKHLPKTLNHFKKNDWIRGYFLLLPISAIGTFLISNNSNYTSFITLIFSLPVFIFFYTFFFAGLFCCIYIYQELKRDEQTEIKKSISKIIGK